MDSQIVTQTWSRCKMTPKTFYARLRDNPRAVSKRLGSRVEVMVGDLLVARYHLPDEILEYRPQPTNGESTPDESPPTDRSARRAPRPSAPEPDLPYGGPHGEPVCPGCGRVMQIKFNLTDRKPFWSCSSFPVCRSTRRFVPRDEDMAAAGGLYDVALAYSLRHYLGEDFSHMYNVQDEEIAKRRRLRSQKVTDRTLTALALIMLRQPTAADFCAAFWPTSRGNPGYLTQLVKRGLVCRTGEGTYRATHAGEAIIAEAQQEGKL